MNIEDALVRKHKNKLIVLSGLSLPDQNLSEVASERSINVFLCAGQLQVHVTVRSDQESLDIKNLEDIQPQ